MLFAVALFTMGCARYSIMPSQKDPADIHYKKKTAGSYFWGIVNNPHRVVDTTCGTAGLSEIKITGNIGYSILHVITLGIVHLVTVEWKCQKSEPVIGFQP